MEKLKLFITKLKTFCIRGTQIDKVKTRTAQTAPTKTSFAAIWNRTHSYWNVKGKGKVRPSTGHEGSEGKWMRSSTLSLTSTLEGGAWLTPRPANLPAGKRHRTDCMGVWVGTRAGPDGCEKSRPHRDFFVLSCTLNVLHPFLLLCLDYPATQHPCPRRNSNPQPQQATGGRLSSSSARLRGSAGIRSRSDSL